MRNPNQRLYELFEEESFIVAMQLRLGAPPRVVYGHYGHGAFVSLNTKNIEQAELEDLIRGGPDDPDECEWRIFSPDGLYWFNPDGYPHLLVTIDKRDDGELEVWIHRADVDRPDKS